jgi:hypothetical protein
MADGAINGEIVHIQLYEQHTGLLVSLPQMIDPDNCGRRDWFYLTQGVFYREAYALLLTAHVTKKTLGFILSGCHEGIPKISHIMSHKDS